MIAFWQNGDNNYRTHKQGLTEEQIAYLQALKPGDRLVLFVSRYKDKDTAPDVTLKRAEPRTEL